MLNWKENASGGLVAMRDNRKYELEEVGGEVFGKCWQLTLRIDGRFTKDTVAYGDLGENKALAALWDRGVWDSPRSPGDTAWYVASDLESFSFSQEQITDHVNTTRNLPLGWELLYSTAPDCCCSSVCATWKS
jgi:hypothetical protein